MKVKKIKINNFRGLKDLEVNLFDFNNFNGKNGIGKSTIIDSVMWCLCGETLVYGKQDSDNRNSNSIRDIINVVLTIDFDGTETTLERKYYDNWVIDKEGNEKFSEVKNLFFVNGAKYKKDEYFDFIKNIINVPSNIKLPKDFNLLRCLIDYNYYSSIDYKVARKFTEELLTLKPDNELLNEERFEKIRGDMQIANYDFAKCLNKYANTKKETEVLISDKTTLLNDYKSRLDLSKIEELEKLREQVKEEIAKNFDFEPKTTSIFKRLEENRLIIQNLVKNQNNAVFELQNNVEQLKKEYESTQTQLKVNESQYQTEFNHQIQLKKDIQNYEELIQYSLNEKKEITKCPYCGEIVNKEELEEFELKSQKRTENIKNMLKKAKNDLENTNQKISALTKTIIEERDIVEDKKLKLNEKELELKTLKNAQDNTEINKLKAQEQELLNQLEQEREIFNTNKNNRLLELTKTINDYSQISTLPSVIEDLEKQIKELKTIVFNCELKKDLVQEFKETKLALIKNSTHTVFPQLDFEILEINENTGATKEVCYAKLKNVEYKGVNDGHRKLVGITIIEDIKKALNIKDLPLIFDKRADIDDTMLNQIKGITNAQILTTSVSNDSNIKNKGE